MSLIRTSTAGKDALEEIPKLKKEIRALDEENTALAERVNELEGKGTVVREAHAFRRMEFWRARAEFFEAKLSRIRDDDNANGPAVANEALRDLESEPVS